MNNRIETDVVIIGAGPAGMTAAIYCARAGLNVKVLEKESIGGKILSTPDVQNIPGFVSISGMDFAMNMSDQLDKLNVGVDYCEATKIEKCEECKLWKVDTDSFKYKCKAVIIATGTKNRVLGLEGEDKLIGHGISFCVTCDGPFYKDKCVAVIGGGNSAVTEAIELAKTCAHVTVVQDLSKLTAEQNLIDELNSLDNVQVIYNAKVTKYRAYKKKLESIYIQTKEDETREIIVDGVFLAIGMAPATDVFKGAVFLDEWNYIKAKNAETSRHGIFACGDCASDTKKQVAVACGSGATAGMKAIEFINEKN